MGVTYALPDSKDSLVLFCASYQYLRSLVHVFSGPEPTPPQKIYIYIYIYIYICICILLE